VVGANLVAHDGFTRVALPLPLYGFLASKLAMTCNGGVFETLYVFITFTFKPQRRPQMQETALS
jgi:hypothetical protein